MRGIRLVLALVLSAHNTRVRESSNENARLLENLSYQHTELDAQKHMIANQHDWPVGRNVRQALGDPTVVGG